MPTDIPAGCRVLVTSYVEPGQIIVMADFSHPETFSTEGEVPDGRIVACHPDDEQRVRDAIARAQETPKWWLDVQQLLRLIGGDT